jgi:four helix bundle protein
MKSHRDLEIYKLSYELAVKVHIASLKLPQYELFEEGGQMRRSSKGVPGCIAEGYGRRRYKAEFIRYLVFAHASCDETVFHLSMVKDTHREMAATFQPFIKSYEELGSKIHKFIEYVDNHWNKNL